MDVGVRETLACYLNELVHEFVILLTTDPGLSKTQIQLIVEKFLVLGSFSWTVRVTVWFPGEAHVCSAV